jgi:hypothetical protein
MIAQYAGSVMKSQSPLTSEGRIVTYSYPTGAQLGEPVNWSATIMNAGTKGSVGLGIVNQAGNIGNITVTYYGEETVIPPGNYLRLWYDDVEPDEEFSLDGTVKYDAEGTYTIKLWAMHLEGGTWYYDEEIPLSVSVSGQEYPVKKTYQIFNNRVLRSSWQQDWVWDSKQNSAPIDTEVLLGGKLIYSIEVQGGNGWVYDATVRWNDIDVFTAPERLKKGDIITGEIDLTGQILPKNEVSVGFYTYYAAWAELVFTVYLECGFSEEPETNPEWKDKWIDQIIPYVPVMVLAGLGVFAITRLTNRNQPLIVFQDTRREN